MTDADWEGIGALFGVAMVGGLLIAYWYVAIPVLVRGHSGARAYRLARVPVAAKG